MKLVSIFTFLFTNLLLAGCASTLSSGGLMQTAQVEIVDEVEIADRVQIITACDKTEHDYAIFRDRYDAESFANIFTEDGEWGRSSGRIVKGRDAIRDYVLNLKSSAAEKPPELQMQLTTTVQITPLDSSSAMGVSYALILEAPMPAQGPPATNVVGFQLASESRSTYKIIDGDCQIATREYTTLFVDP